MRLPYCHRDYHIASDYHIATSFGSSVHWQSVKMSSTGDPFRKLLFAKPAKARESGNHFVPDPINSTAAIEIGRGGISPTP